MKGHMLDRLLLLLLLLLPVTMMMTISKVTLDLVSKNA
jgi:hypothetical protein